MEIKLSKPLKINGSDVQILHCDFDKLTTQDFMAASAESAAQAAAAGGVSLGAEFDPGFHVALCIRAIARTMPAVDILDIKRITGADILQLQRAGRTFCLGGLSEG